MEFTLLFIVLFTLLLVFIISLGMYLLTSFIYKYVLEKDNRNGWYGFIPVYRDYQLIEMSGLNWYWIVVLYAPVVVGIIMTFVPFVGTIGSSALMILSKIASVNLYIYLSKRFHAEDWLVIVAAIFPIIGLGILAFSKKYVYDKTVEIQPDGFLGDLGIIKNEKIKPNTTNVEEPIVTEEPKQEEKKSKPKTTKKSKKEE